MLKIIFTSLLPKLFMYKMQNLILYKVVFTSWICLLNSHSVLHTLIIVALFRCNCEINWGKRGNEQWLSRDSKCKLFFKLFSDKKWQVCDRMEVVSNTMVAIILQFINVYQINTLCNFNTVLCQLYLNKSGEK